MNSGLFNFSRDLDTLSAEDMFKISQDLNTIEPSVGEIAQVAPVLEQITFVEIISIVFVMTLIVFALMPKIKKIGSSVLKQSKA